MSVLTNSLKHESHELSLLDLNGVKLKTMRALYAGIYRTRRELHEETGIAIATLCGALKRLENEGWVRVAFDELDEKTNRHVAVYTVTTAAAAVRINCAGGTVKEHWAGTDTNLQLPPVALP